jgi:hypothetical protein
MLKATLIRLAFAVGVFVLAGSVRAAPFPVDCCDEYDVQERCFFYCAQLEMQCDHWECDYDPFDPECLGFPYYYCI